MSDIAAVVLAGGRSTRMGRDKAALVLGGRSLLQRTLDAAAEVASSIVVVTARGQSLPPMDQPVSIRLVVDEYEEAGPLAGLLAGLSAIQSPIALLLACDQPFLQPALLRLLAAETSGADAVVPVANGKLQPLCSAVRVETLADLRATFAQGTRAASAVAELPRAHRMRRNEWSRVDPEGLSFIGVNTPEEFARAGAILSRLASGAR